MARIPQPWYWEKRDGWYVTRFGQRHFLGEHPASASRPRQVNGKWNTPESIRTKFHELMASSTQPASPAVVPQNGRTVAELFEKYLDWCEKHREPRTYAGYRWHLQHFVTHLAAKSQLSAMDLKPFHVVEWLDAHPGWGPNYRRNAITAVKRVYNWAEELGYLASNPIRTIKKPSARRREAFVKPEEWALIRNSYSEGDPFRDLMEFIWETGCRPQEARHIERRHVHWEKSVIAIPPEEAKGRKKWRLIRLEGPVCDLVKRRLTLSGEKLFTNADGNAWTSSAVNCRFARLKLKLGTRFSAYAFRHGFATRLLVNGVDHLTVSELLGHSDGTMLAKVYQHLDQSDAHLRAALRKRSVNPEVTEG